MIRCLINCSVNNLAAWDVFCELREQQGKGHTYPFIDLPWVPRKGDFVEINGYQFEVIRVVFSADHSDIMLMVKQ